MITAITIRAMMTGVDICPPDSIRVTADNQD
jgi:hypothetical protein